jgi:hypothetical protein
MERESSGFPLGLHTSPLPATHAKAGTGLTDTDQGLHLRHQSNLHWQVHSQPATSCRTALSTPGTAVPSRPGAIPDRRLPPHSGRSLSPRYHEPSRGVQVTRHQQGFTVVHPSQPSPRLWSPDGTGTLGLFPELRTRLSRTQQRTSGRGRASALPGVTSSASLTSFDGLTPHERPHVALAL